MVTKEHKESRSLASKQPTGVERRDPDQHARFLEAARELGCEKNFDRFDEALKRAAKAPPQHRKHAPKSAGKDAKTEPPEED
ncbi:MAG: hypothetical protein KDG89_14255 [Geminicoccaceae bacterium]|nr:hypothetical protein [Geminicoccaceae bacterium]